MVRCLFVRGLLKDRLYLPWCNLVMYPGIVHDLSSVDYDILKVSTMFMYVSVLDLGVVDSVVLPLVSPLSSVSVPVVPVFKYRSDKKKLFKS